MPYPFSEKAQRQRTARQLVKQAYTQTDFCPHGISITESCWWCSIEEKKLIKKNNRPLEQRVQILEERFDALLKVVSMLLQVKLPSRVVLGGSVTTVINQITDGGLIQSGNDADKPNSNSLAFWYATDTDTIYQRRDNDWINISYSRPTAPDSRITNIEVDDTTGTVEVTHE